MCHTTIHPILTNLEYINPELSEIIRILNHWQKMLINYGKLDGNGSKYDFNVIAEVIKSKCIHKRIKRAVLRCRDCALAGTVNTDRLLQSVKTALNIICKNQEGKEIRALKKFYADQGMTERYRPLTKRLRRVTIHKIDRKLMYTDYHTSDAKTTRLVRRIVEKRSAQMAHKLMCKRCRETNKSRYSTRRAISFNLYYTNFTEFNGQRRAAGTHWKVISRNSKGKKILKAKIGYNSYEDAVMACNRYNSTHPKDLYVVTAYKCKHCGKWHIGHDRLNEYNSKAVSYTYKDNNDKIIA